MMPPGHANISEPGSSPVATRAKSPPINTAPAAMNVATVCLMRATVPRGIGYRITPDGGWVRFATRTW
jgi:hypothetical protein